MYAVADSVFCFDSLLYVSLGLKNVLVTGGNTMLPHFESRVEREIRAIRPFQSSFNVTASCKSSICV